MMHPKVAGTVFGVTVIGAVLVAPAVSGHFNLAASVELTIMICWLVAVAAAFVNFMAAERAHDRKCVEPPVEPLARFFWMGVVIDAPRRDELYAAFQASFDPGVEVTDATRYAMLQACGDEPIPDAVLEILTSHYSGTSTRRWPDGSVTGDSVRNTPLTVPVPWRSRCLTTTSDAVDQLVQVHESRLDCDAHLTERWL